MGAAGSSLETAVGEFLESAASEFKASLASQLQAVAEAASGQAVLPVLVREEQALMKAAAAAIQSESQSDDATKSVRQCRRMLAEAEKEHGPKHPDALGAANDLALSLQASGRLDEAESLFRRTLAGFEEAFGAEHRKTLCILNNLAVLLDDQGRLQEAEVLYRRALQGCKTALGASHADTLQTSASLAALLRAAGRPQEAADLYAEVLQRREASQKSSCSDDDVEEHLQCLSGHAAALDACGAAGAAELVLRRALRLCEGKLGAWHPDALCAAQHLGEVLLAQHASSVSQERPSMRRARGLAKEEDLLLKEAEAVFRRALTGRRAQLGAEHPRTLRSAQGLGQALLQRAQAGGVKAQLRLREAESLLRRCAEQPEDARRPQDAAASRAALAFCLQLLQRSREAEELYRSSVPTLRHWADRRLRKETDGSARPRRLLTLGASVEGATSSAHNFAALLAGSLGSEMDRSAEALELYRWALGTCRATQGAAATSRRIARNLRALLTATGAGASDEVKAIDCEFFAAPPLPGQSGKAEKQAEKQQTEQPKQAAEADAGESDQNGGKELDHPPRLPEPLLAAWPRRGAARRSWRQRRGGAPRQLIGCCAVGTRMILKQLQQPGSIQECDDNLTEEPCAECRGN
eukprot:gb/GFBE01044726.1/.p1 GENE.gb/GFBE01044726.1/~~gb/GFBE01044726.1/.p1  ORF type:complete len:639 (+),score=159.68 gb/GFBE01044726.1/:1-1917(+)